MQEVDQREQAVPAMIETQVQVAEVDSGDVGVKDYIPIWCLDW